MPERSERNGYKYDKDVFDFCDDKDKEYHAKHGTCHQIWYPKDSEDEEISDLEDVEIFIDYGGGSCILGQASKSKRLILSPLNEIRYPVYKQAIARTVKQRCTGR